MSDISTYLQQIMQARYGEEVRGAIHDAIEECYDDVSTAKTLADQATADANAAASAANTAAADAASAASAIAPEVADLKSISDSLIINVNSQSLWTNGGISVNSGLNSDPPAQNRIRTKTYIDQSTIAISSSEGWDIGIFAYNRDDGNYIGMWNGSEFQKSGLTWLAITVGLRAWQIGNDYAIRIVARKHDNSDIDASYYENVSIYQLTDDTFSIPGAPADAAKVSVALDDITDNIGNTKSDLEDQIRKIVVPETGDLYSEFQHMDSNYMYIPTTGAYLVAGTEYRLILVANEAFSTEVLQLGTAGNVASMVDTIAENISLAANVPYELDFVPSVEGERYLRILGNASKLKSSKVYEIKRVIVDGYNVIYYDHQMNLSGEEKTTVLETLGIKDDIDCISDEESYYKLYSQADAGNNDSYRFVYDNVFPQLEAGVDYKLMLVASEDVSFENLQLGTAANVASMVDTIAENVSLQEDVPAYFEFNPTQSNMKYFRFLNVARKIKLAAIYKKSTRKKQMYDDIGLYNLALGYKQNYYGLSEMKNLVDKSVDGLLRIQLGTPVEKTVTLPSVGEKETAYVRVGLHYGAPVYNPADSDIFFNGACKTDFSDVRFFDADGNMLKAQFGPAVHLDLLRDPKIQYYKRHLSDGTMVGFQDANGIVLSQNSGNTWTPIPGTANVTENPSAVYSRLSMFPLMVDNNDNIFAYAGGILYKLLSSDNYTTKRAVLDFSWIDDGSVIYPDVQDHAMVQESDGTIFVGACYQEQYHVSVYVSHDGGETFTLCWYKYGDTGNYQHVHNISYDPYNHKTYVQIDDGGYSYTGARIIVTEDHGVTWTEITTDDNHEVRGRDYYPTYFGDGTYRLGGGETYIMGKATIYRSENDVNYDCVVKGVAGVRGFADFGDDSLIITGSQDSTVAHENHVLMSTDKGRTWVSVAKYYQPISSASGAGWRKPESAFTLYGESEPCVLFPEGHGLAPALRIFKGGDHYYREAWIELKNTEDTPVTIIAKTGFAMEYPYANIYGKEHEGLVYNVPLNEGAGKYICDSIGNIAQINGRYRWEDDDHPVRYGDYCGANTSFSDEASSALMLEDSAYANFGHIKNLQFKKNFTITFWLNCNELWLNVDKQYYEFEKRKAHKLMSINDLAVYMTETKIGYTLNDKFFGGIPSDYACMKTQRPSHFYSNQYFFICIAVDASNKVTVYLNGEAGSTQSESGDYSSIGYLSDGDFIIGGEFNTSQAYISDIKVYNRCINADEILEMYRGL